MQLNQRLLTINVAVEDITLNRAKHATCATVVVVVTVAMIVGTTIEPA